MKIKWIDRGSFAKCPPNPSYPDGIDIDLTQNGEMGCFAKLPYPAKRLGLFIVTCSACGNNAAITTAGRPDDPRSIRLPCKIKNPRQ